MASLAGLNVRPSRGVQASHAKLHRATATRCSAVGLRARALGVSVTPAVREGGEPPNVQPGGCRRRA